MIHASIFGLSDQNGFPVVQMLELEREYQDMLELRNCIEAHILEDHNYATILSTDRGDTLLVFSRYDARAISSARENPPSASPLPSVSR